MGLQVDFCLQRDSRLYLNHKISESCHSHTVPGEMRSRSLPAQRKEHHTSVAFHLCGSFFNVFFSSKQCQ